MSLNLWIKQNWTAFSIGVLVLSALWMAFNPPLADSVTGGLIPAPQQGFLAPDFSLQDEQGQTIHLSDLRGKPVLINFWASWCPPCQAEMPAMQSAHQAYTSRDFVILAVNTTFQDTQPAALEFAQRYKLTFPILFDQDGAVSVRYQVRAMPTSFFVDRKGVIRKVVIGGPMTEALINAEIEQLLGEGQ